MGWGLLLDDAGLGGFFSSLVTLLPAPSPGFFSSDRTIGQSAKEIWNAVPVPVGDEPDDE